VEELIKASLRKASPSAYTGFGRELQPFAFDDGEMPWQSLNGTSAKKESRPAAPVKGAKATNSSSNKHPRGPGAKPAFPEFKASRTQNKSSPDAARRALVAPQPDGAQPAPELRAQQFTALVAAEPVASPAAAPSPPAATSPACPGFAMSPKPRTLPTPTGMLQRAALAKARTGVLVEVAA
jgi:hypothetical protein